MNHSADAALSALLAELSSTGYRFVTITPASHKRVLARREMREAGDLRGMLGWSLPFPPGLAPRIETLLAQADMLTHQADGRLRSRVRVSSAGELLFLHSAYPTTEPDTVFFGPDSYRFADFIAGQLTLHPLTSGATIVDFGAGSGIGGITAARRTGGARVTLVETNPKAQRFAWVNARAAGVSVQLADSLSSTADLIVINPPYIIDPLGRAYRDGGGLHGGEVALSMAHESSRHLSPGGRILLYAGAAIVEGRNDLRDALAGLAAEVGLSFRSHELDPDVFGEELAGDAYRDVERIALIGAVLERPN